MCSWHGLSTGRIFVARLLVASRAGGWRVLGHCGLCVLLMQCGLFRGRIGVEGLPFVAFGLERVSRHAVGD